MWNKVHGGNMPSASRRCVFEYNDLGKDTQASLELIFAQISFPCVVDYEILNKLWSSAVFVKSS